MWLDNKKEKKKSKACLLLWRRVMKFLVKLKSEYLFIWIITLNFDHFLNRNSVVNISFKNLLNKTKVYLKFGLNIQILSKISITTHHFNREPEKIKNAGWYYSFYIYWYLQSISKKSRRHTRASLKRRTTTMLSDLRFQWSQRDGEGCIS